MPLPRTRSTPGTQPLMSVFVLCTSKASKVNTRHHAGRRRVGRSARRAPARQTLRRRGPGRQTHRRRPCICQQASAWVVGGAGGGGERRAAEEARGELPRRPPRRNTPHQSLYFCTSKASKVSTVRRALLRPGGSQRAIKRTHTTHFTHASPPAQWRGRLRCIRVQMRFLHT